MISCGLRGEFKENVLENNNRLQSNCNDDNSFEYIHFYCWFNANVWYKHPEAHFVD